MKQIKRILLSTFIAASMISTNLVAHKESNAKHSKYFEQTGMMHYSNSLSLEYRRLAESYARKGYKDVACNFEKKAEAIECGRNVQPEPAFTNNVGCTELEASRSLVLKLNQIKINNNCIKYKYPSMTAEIQARYDNWTTAQCLGLPCANKAKADFYASYEKLMRALHECKGKAEPEMMFKISSELPKYLNCHNMVARFHFAFDKYEHPLQQDKNLMISRTLLNSYNSGDLIVINAHSCATGNITYNSKLAEKRALTVKHMLIEKGVKAEAIHIVNFGISNANNLAFDYSQSKFIKAQDIRHIQHTDIRSLNDKQSDRRVEVFVLKESHCNDCNKCKKQRCQKSNHCNTHNCNHQCKRHSCKTRAGNSHGHPALYNGEHKDCKHNNCRHQSTHNAQSWYNKSYCSKTECLCKCHHTKMSHKNKCRCGNAYAMQASKISAEKINLEKVNALRDEHNSHIKEISNANNKKSHAQKSMGKSGHDNASNSMMNKHHSDNNHDWDDEQDKGFNNDGWNDQEDLNKKQHSKKHHDKRMMTEKDHDNEERYNESHYDDDAFVVIKK